MTLADIANLMAIKDCNDTTPFHGISINTRTLAPNNLFIALQGNHVDGHDCLQEALDKGAAAALVQRKMPVAIPQLVVNNVISAMGKATCAWRKRFSMPLVAITGSNGKTTVKNMLAAILAAAVNDPQQVLYTQGTLNNDLGLPLTLARLSQQHRYAVIEMGMNHFNEIDYLTKLALPTHAIITNAAACHLEGVGDLAGVAKAKAEIFQGLQPLGVAILNQDDTFFDYWRQQLHSSHTCLSFGMTPEADIYSKKFSLINGKLVINIQTPHDNFEIILPLLGQHNIMNALAATAAAVSLNIATDAIKQGLENIEPAPGRLQQYRLANDVIVIDDSYNANPYSLEAAVATLQSFAGKKILIFADMKELGDDAKKIHYLAGEMIRQADIDYLFTYGNLASITASAFGEKGYHFSDIEKLIKALQPFLCSKTTMLVKGSRSMQMEKVVERLRQISANLLIEKA
jgi:UDP-N-acetylmuramoyl-tripeptide--D-alanyl-D-alanine ligase